MFSGVGRTNSSVIPGTGPLSLLPIMNRLISTGFVRLGGKVTLTRCCVPLWRQLRRRGGCPPLGACVLASAACWTLQAQAQVQVQVQVPVQVQVQALALSRVLVWTNWSRRCSSCAQTT